MSFTAVVEAVEQVEHIDLDETVIKMASNVQAGWDQLLSKAVVDRFRHQLGAVKIVGT